MEGMKSQRKQREAADLVSREKRNGLLLIIGYSLKAD